MEKFTKKKVQDLLEAFTMLEAIQKARLTASELGFDGLWFALDDMAKGLVKHYNLAYDED